LRLKPHALESSYEDLLVHVKRRDENLEPGEVGDDVPELLADEGLLAGCELDSESDRDRVSALKMSSRLTLFALRVTRVSMREFSSICSVNLETTILDILIFLGVELLVVIEQRREGRSTTTHVRK